jgi:hypothetical protein
MKKIIIDKQTGSLKKTFLLSIVGGIGWAFGASIGFALLIALITYILGLLGGLPYIGKFFGQIIENTTFYLNSGLK